MLSHQLACLTLGFCIVVGCSSTDSSENAVSGGQSGVGGSASTGGTGSSQGGSTSIVAGGAGAGTTGCPIWPQEKLFPYIGAFFYGPDPKPCTVDLGDGVVQTFQYDANGQLTGATTVDDALISVFTFTNGQLSQQVNTSPATVETFTFQYGSGTVGYSVTGGPSPYTTIYTLDERGYPQSVVSEIEASTPTVYHYTYTYDGCRMIARTAYDANGVETPTASVQYEYDTEGHLVRAHSATGSIDWRWDYSCR